MKHWYAAHVIMAAKSKTIGSMVTVFEDVYLVYARGRADALRKAIAHGRRAEDRTGLTIDGKAGGLFFEGVRKLVCCAANPFLSGPSEPPRVQDGMEATYNRYRLSRSQLRRLASGMETELVYEQEQALRGRRDRQPGARKQ